MNSYTFAVEKQQCVCVQDIRYAIQSFVLNIIAFVSRQVGQFVIEHHGEYHTLCKLISQITQPFFPAIVQNYLCLCNYILLLCLQIWLLQSRRVSSGSIFHSRQPHAAFFAVWLQSVRIPKKCNLMCTKTSLSSFI